MAAIGLLTLASEAASARDDANIPEQPAAPALTPDGAAPPGAAYHGQVETSFSLFGQADDTDAPGLLTRSYSLAARGGRRFGDLGVFGTLESNLWLSPLLDGDSELLMAVNLGIGGEVWSAGGLLRTSLALGASMLAIPGEVDNGGELGVFFDLRPLGVRLVLADGWFLGIDPVGLTVLAPVLAGIPLFELQFRTSTYLEYGFP